MFKALASIYKDPKGGLDELALGGHAALAAMGWSSVMQVIHGIPLDVQGLGVGCAAVLGAMGGGMRARDGATNAPSVAANTGPVVVAGPVGEPTQPGSTGSM